MSELFTPIHPNLPKSNSRFEPTGESIGGRFSEMPLSANEEQYDRRKKSSAEKPLVTKKLEKEPSKYLAIALSMERDGVETAIETGKNDAIEKWLIKSNILKIEDGEIILNDKDGLAALRGTQKKDAERTYLLQKWHIPSDLQQYYDLPYSEVDITSKDFFSYFNNRPARIAGSGEVLPITTLPVNFSDIATGAYPSCHVKPWELPPVKRTMWDEPLLLNDGTVTNLAELHITEIFHRLNIEPQGNGRFLITDPATQERRSVVTNELAGKFLPVYGSRHENTIALRNNTADFAQRYFKNLDRLNILNPSHFRKSSGSFESSIVAPSDRRLSANSFEVSLQTPGGKSVKYYLGRDKIVGTDIPFDKENMVVRYLDNRTAGIVRIDKNVEEILCTFSLASPEEIEGRREQTRQKLLAEGREVKEGDLGARTGFGGPEMKERIRLYKASDYLPQFPDEDAKSYADRIARLSDARLISKDAREFFQRSGIGLHQLPWSEQLAASSILLDPRFKKEEVASFCAQYGIDGLRTFISSAHGKNISSFILSMGKHLQPEISVAVFRKHAEILDVTKQISSYIEATVSHSVSPETLSAIETKILKKAHSLLQDFFAVAFTNSFNFSGKNLRDPKTITHYLDSIDTLKGDIELFKATFKTLKECGKDVSLEDFRDNSILSQTGEEIPSPEIDQMRIFYLKSMQDYPDETRKELLEAFDSHMKDAKSRLTILKHKDEVAGFLCFTETQPGQKYVSAVTLDPRFQKAYIGEAMIDEAFAREASENILGADCVAQKSVSARYIENGFIGVRSWDDKGDLIMDIVRDDRRNEKYFSTKALSQDEIIKLAPLGRIGTARIEVVSDPKEHAFSLCNEGFVLTRYFKDPASKKWYLVYEPKPTKTPVTESISHQEETLD